MLRRPLLTVALVPAVGSALLLPACGDDTADGDAGDVLAGRVVALLEADGGALLDGDVGDADVRCPDVVGTQPGDRATCVVTLAGGRVVEVDVEFDDTGAITVVAVVPR